MIFVLVCIKTQNHSSQHTNSLTYCSFVFPFALDFENVDSPSTARSWYALSFRKYVANLRHQFRGETFAFFSSSCTFCDGKFKKKKKMQIKKSLKAIQAFASTSSSSRMCYKFTHALTLMVMNRFTGSFRFSTSAYLISDRQGR